MNRSTLSSNSLRAQPTPAARTPDAERLLRLDGNQAVAHAALDAGIGLFAHYPGSPVNRVELEIRRVTAERGRELAINDALNEHVATLAAAGASFSGARSLVVMKHVGLNIAADPLGILGYAGLRAGMVVVVGTDPGARSSTGEQDVHGYANQFNAPCFEPADVQGVYDCVREAFETSERAAAPALVLIPGRIANQSELVHCGVALQPDASRYRFEHDRQAFINVGERAVENHRKLVERIELLAHEPAATRRRGNPQARIGLLTRGATCALVNEVIAELELADEVDALNVERLFPLHLDSLLDFARGKQRLLVIEDQDGYLEQQLKFLAFNQLDCEIHGKSLFPSWGEVTREQIRSVLAHRFERPLAAPSPIELRVPERPGTFCEGCPHRGAYFGIERALAGREHVLGGDIGCSSLPPFKADWLLCMNAGVGISQGISQVSRGQSVLSTGGEGSLFHGGLLSLQSAVQNGIDLVHVLLDNQAVAMTGHQASPTTPGVGGVDVAALLAAIGVRRVFEVNAFEPTRVERAVRAACELQGVVVVWVRGRCALLPDEESLRRRRVRTLTVEVERCAACTLCHQELDCPAILGSSQDLSLHFDMTRCARCAACLDICPNDAIRVSEAEEA